MEATALKINIQPTKKSRIHEIEEGLKNFGRVFSDHMYVIDYLEGEWKDARIVPYGDLPMSPATSALHYGQAVFEGMKAYRNEADEILLFRATDNLKRLNKSAVRLCMPEIPEELFMDGLKELLKLDKNWISQTEGASLYIRPFMFGTDEYIGVKPSESYRLIIFTNPVGHYYAKPVKVKVETRFTRAAEGGVGFAKAAGNYAASLYPAKLGQEQGFDQLIWTDPIEHKYVEESGTMNLMFLIGNTLVTPNTSETILAGVTRDSVVQVAKHWGYNVEERKISVTEVVEAHNNGTLKEMFGTGTAATIAHIAMFHNNGTNYELPPVENRELSNKISAYLDELKRANVEDPFGWVTKV